MNHNDQTATAFGLAAGNAFAVKDSAHIKANQNAIAACALAQSQMIFEAKVMAKDGETIEETFSFALFDVLTPLKNENANNDAKRNNARFAAILSRLFDIRPNEKRPSLYGNALVQVKAAIEIASKIMAAGYVFGRPNTDGEIAFGWDDKTNRLIVPYEFVNKEPKADADANSKTEYKRGVGSPVLLDGKKKCNYESVKAIAIPAKSKGTNETKTKGTPEETLTNSLKFLFAALTDINASNGKNDGPKVVLNESNYALLFKVVQAANVLYLAEQPDAPERKVDKNTRASKG